MTTHADFAGLVTDVVGRYGYWPTGDPEPVTSGTLNWNFRISTDGGEYFVRRYRDDLETERIRGEHQLVAWAAERGVPAPLPESVPDGPTWLELAGGRWAIYPWIEGELVPRGQLSPHQAQTLGALQGFTQSVLAHHPDSQGANLSMRWSKDESLALLRRIEGVPPKSSDDEVYQRAVTKQRETLEALDVLPPEAFAGLPCQVLHGDFHDHQVLWQGDSIAALVDWEIWHTDPRVWELVRSLAFTRILGEPLMADYLAGYRAHVSLTEDECRLGIRMWWQSRVVGLWAWAAYFLQGNTRVDRFFPAMIAESDLIADEAWRKGVEERFVAGALG